jgi:serine/threonine protein kinase
MAGRLPNGASPTPVGTAGERLGDRYQLLRPLARGGMAEVWEATDTVLGRSVAAKILYPHLAADPGFRARFKREAVSAARLNHPAIVTVFDTGIDERSGGESIRAYIIMEMVPGRTMRALMTEGALGVDDSISIVAQAADGLAFAHTSGFVHRDVKPGNIMVQPDGRVKVADFGIAKTLQAEIAGSDQEDLTQVGSILGTAKYLSPEQVDGTAIDARSDIYSLGVVLYEAVCGRPPFVGATDLATAMLHVNGTTQRPRQIRPELSRSLERVIMTSMARDPAHRYQRASELARALRTVEFDDDAAPIVDRTYAAETPAHGIDQSGLPTGTTNTTRTRYDGQDFDDSESSTVLMDERTRLAVRPTDGTRSTAKVATRTTSVLRPDSTSDNTDGQQRRRLPKFALASLMAIGLAVGGLGGWTTGSRTLTELPITTVSSFDPKGADGENDNRLDNLTDGSRSAWSTETYTRGFAAVSKRGVGVVFDLGEDRSVQVLQVASLTNDWNAVVYTGDVIGSDLASWGKVVTRLEPTPAGTITFPVQRTARYVMLWVDELGPNTSVSLAEVKVFG